MAKVKYKYQSKLCDAESNKGAHEQLIPAPKPSFIRVFHSPFCQIIRKIYAFVMYILYRHPLNTVNQISFEFWLLCATNEWVQQQIIFARLFMFICLLLDWVLSTLRSHTQTQSMNLTELNMFKHLLNHCVKYTTPMLRWWWWWRWR